MVRAVGPRTVLTRMMQLPEPRQSGLPPARVPRAGQPTMDLLEPGPRRARATPKRLRMTDRVLEHDYERTVESALLVRRWRFVHHVTARLPGGRYVTAYSSDSSPGFPDIVAMRRGWQIAAELKQAGRYPTQDQRIWLTLFAAMPRTLAWVLRPSDPWDQVAHWLDHPEDAPVTYGWKPK